MSSITVLASGGQRRPAPAVMVDARGAVWDTDLGVRWVRKLVVLVGPAGSGKTTFRYRHPEWVVVSKDDIRRYIFRHDFDQRYEEAVASIFAAALVEAVESPAEVVCVDNTNLTRDERRVLVEVAHDSDRQSIAYVMASKPIEILYKRKLEQLDLLASNNRDIVVGGYPEERYRLIYRRYEQVGEDEGFSKVFREVDPATSVRKRKVRSPRRKTATLRRLDALPLFSQL